MLQTSGAVSFSPRSNAPLVDVPHAFSEIAAFDILDNFLGSASCSISTSCFLEYAIWAPCISRRQPVLAAVPKGPFVIRQRCEMLLPPGRLVRRQTGMHSGGMRLSTSSVRLRLHGHQVSCNLSRYRDDKDIWLRLSRSERESRAKKKLGCE